MVKLTHLFDSNNSTLEEVQLEMLRKKNITLFVKRDDKIDKYVSGNKWRKLKYNIEAAISRKSDAIITFGGAHSNHLLATASACNKAGIKSIGIVRGEELTANANESLKDCFNFGMELHFISRDEYYLRDDASYKADLQAQFPNSFIIPEGGANYYGLMGCAEIWKEITPQIDHMFLSAGTACTATGLLLNKPENTSIHVVSALKGDFQKKQMESLLYSAFLESDMQDELFEKVKFHNNYHFGGYAKTTTELYDFIASIKAKTALPLDSIYTGKAFFGMLEEIQKSTNYNNTTICFLHTGGLLGNR
jgi:1-aminocyclopropane-1-carboxylate deaminase